MPKPMSVADRPSTGVEIAIGWSLAACLHPVAAWRVLSGPRRFLIAGAYGLATYVGLLSALLLFA
jgi:hypothetical protein